jgi:pyridinium-3,5-biscarboxylic acid mononucleotide sulfurtransferase
MAARPGATAIPMGAHPNGGASQTFWEDARVDVGLARKLSVLHDLLERMERVVVAYSGGVDSSFLMSAAWDVLGKSALAITAVSPSLARTELSEARQLAKSRGWPHEVVSTHELEREEYARNATDRCYWCKRELFDVLDPIAREHQARVVLGTVVDDLGDFRPGLLAAAEYGAGQPLVDAGLTKVEVRALSRAAGLPTAEKAASPCLASRIAYGVRVEAPRLRRVEAAESFLRSLGFDVCRVRDHGDHATVEVDVLSIPRAISLESKIAENLLGLGFTEVVIDPNGYRRGSLNESETVGVQIL